MFFEENPMRVLRPNNLVGSALTEPLYGGREERLEMEGGWWEGVVKEGGSEGEMDLDLEGDKGGMGGGGASW